MQMRNIALGGITLSLALSIGIACQTAPNTNTPVTSTSPANPPVDTGSAEKKDTPSPQAIREEAERQQKVGVPLQLDVLLQVMNICSSSPVPAGWIKVNDHWNPTICGNPPTIVYNVLTIERFDNRAVGSVMTVCSSAPTPGGWVEVNNHWDPTRCGHPPTIVNNMKQIRRVN